VLLGGPNRIARFNPATLQWSSYPIGVYGHSIGLDDRGRAWFNGHVSRNPEVLGFVDAEGQITRFEVPAHPEADVGAGPMPYELRVAPDGRIWGSELIGNRVFAFDPRTEAFEILTMPTPHSGPRRLDIGPDGTVWIPEYANNALARFRPSASTAAREPGTEARGELREFPLPIPDAEPYVVRVDPRSGIVWMGTGSADAILSFDPASERFTVYRLPTQGALIRHLAVDPRNGDVWAAYGASPGIPSKVARLRIR
jgi:virginiamycin B lyase